MSRRLDNTGIILRTRRTYNYDGMALRLVVMDCASCGMFYGLTKDFSDRRREDGEAWYCPNGHSQVYTEFEADKQRKRAERAEEELAITREQREAARAEAAHQRQVAAGHKGYATQIRNRIKNGVCPFCPIRSGNQPRSFTNVRRHMRTKHPSQFKQHVDA